MATASTPLLHHGASEGGWKLRASFSAPLAAVTVLVVVFFCCFVSYTADQATDAHIDQYYMWVS
jgi:hypothetical protein